MATRREILIVADHMRKRAIATASDRVLSHGFMEAADMLESEARRLQDGEARPGESTFCHCHPGRPMAGCPNPRCQS